MLALSLHLLIFSLLINAIDAIISIIVYFPSFHYCFSPLIFSSFILPLPLAAAALFSIDIATAFIIAADAIAALADFQRRSHYVF